MFQIVLRWECHARPESTVPGEGTGGKEGKSVGCAVFVFLRFYLYIFRQGEGRKKERERNIGCLLHMLQPGTEPTTQARALTRNQTGDFLLFGPTLNHLSHASQGCALVSHLSSST